MPPVLYGKRLSAKRSGPSKLRRGAFILLLVVFLALLWFSGLPALAYFQLAATFGDDASRPLLGLGGYEAKIDGQVVDGLSSDLSGLTYSPKTGTLFAVINRPPQLAELSTDGQLLRKIPLRGVKDPEGLTHIAGDRFIVSDEREQGLHWITIGPGTTAVTAEGGEHLRLDIGGMRNMGFEGLSWDAVRQRLYIAQEMFPARVLVIKGLSSGAGGLNLDISEWKPRGLASSFLLDLSSVSLQEATGNLILLSHMSRILVEYTPDGTVLSFLPLWRGLSGLSASITQAEGVAVGPDGDVFIVAEPNLFYKFGKVAEAAAARPD